MAEVAARIYGDIAEYIKAEAKREKRSASAQAEYFIDLGIAEHKRRLARIRELDLDSGQARDTAAEIERLR